MAHKSIGIEISDRVIKAVVLETGFRGTKILQGIYFPIRSKKEQDEDKIIDEDLFLSLRNIFSGIIESTDIVVVSFPAERVFFKNVELPFRDPKKIESTLAFEFITDIPLNAGDLHCGYEIYEEKQQRVHLLAGGVFIKEFEEFISSFKNAGIDPKVISCGAISFSSLSEYFTDEENFCIINFNKKGFDLIAFDNKKPVINRTINFEDRLEEAIREINQSILFFNDKYREKVKKIWFCGEAEENIIEILNKELPFDFEGIENLHIAINGIEEIKERQRQLCFSLSLALRGLRPSDERRFNFRKGQYAHQGELKLLREKLKYLILFVLVVVFLMGVKTSIKYEGLKKERDKLYLELKSYSKEVLGREVDEFEKAISIMREGSKKDIKILPEWTAVDTFYKITDAIEEGMTGDAEKGEGEGYLLEIENVRVEHHVAYIRGEANTIEAFENYIDKLKKTKCFKDVITESTERINFQRHQGWQRFSIKINIECEEKKEKAWSK